MFQVWQKSPPFGEEEIPECTGCRHHPLRSQSYNEPLSEFRKTDDVECDETTIAYLRRDRVGGDERDAETRHHCLLDRLVRANLHADTSLDAVPREESLCHQSGAGTALAHQHGLAGNIMRRDGTPLGQRMIGRRDDDLRMIADRGALHLDGLRRPTHDRYVEASALERGDGVFPIADDELHGYAGVDACESAEHLRGEVLRRGHHADGDASARQ